MIDYEKTIEKIKDQHKFELAHDIACLTAMKLLDDKIQPLLPDGWKTERDHIGRYAIYKEAAASSTEFLLVCKLIENATGEKLRKELAGSEEFPALRVWQGVHINENFFNVFITQKKPTDCKFEIRNKIIKELVPIDGKCLGLNEV